MRILEVLHFFLPRHSAGTEVYTDSISRELRRRGHDVHLFFTEKVLSARNYDLVHREQQGLHCHVLINNLLYENFEETFDNAAIEHAFHRVLDQVKPDVVHFQHLMLLSLSLPRIARERGIHCVMTLHDFWLYCARFGQLMEHGVHDCEGPKTTRCASCMSDFKFAQTSLQKRMITAIRWTKEVAGFDLAPVVDAWRGSRLLRGTLLGSGKDGDSRAKQPPPSALEASLKRREAMVKENVPHIRLFLAPSRLMRDRMVAFGLAARRVRVLPLGVPRIEVHPRRPLAGREPVFGFIGTLAPHKGVHIAIEAMRYLKGHGELRVYGRSDYYPAYVEKVRAQAVGLPVKFQGAVPRSAIGKAFAEIDALIMPSVWLENFPIIIQEARAAKVPVIASNLGGMAEAIEDGVDGVLFKAGSARDLATKLAALLKHPERLQKLGDAAPTPLTLEAHVDRLEEQLKIVADEAPSRPRGSR
jgi:glycosyltransferase involved in cell wall biosynthesis